ncbi:hypothetical protein TTHERM_00494300 (macronuclear) [Tetrahymena thermophila SB210]|uniref:Uncharacterized protein n=1 Tax=Tetrahymena thermophila (strain SB210) TaxID=312017 RepID=I7M3E2_TETTS|nr:hypothetical protein TTHERM_00494300 [Tetrahymena thermophila SB210]EAS02978.2 hypothetical protein TTHERM_00494300 [Tetrahymena thermophila SB210]|eukprot:XP_001023223.2 hypothetical protein TTHERM_00494300 [Tetrahymena thermophila SB210]
MIQSAGKVMDAPQTFETIQKVTEESNPLDNQRENFFHRQYSSGMQSNQGSAGSLSYHQQNSQLTGNPQVKRINNCNSQDTPQQKVIKKQFSKSKERNSSLTNNNTSNNVQSSTGNNNNNHNNMSINSAKNYQNNLSNQYYQNNISSQINQPISTLACSTINDSSSIYTSAQNPFGNQSNQMLFHTHNNINNNSSNNSAKKLSNAVQCEKNVLQLQNTIKTKDSNVLKDTTIMVGNRNYLQNSSITPKLNNNYVNKNNYCSVPQKCISKDLYSFEYTLQPNHQSLLFRNQENTDPIAQSRQGTMRSEIKLPTDHQQQFYNVENKLPTQSDNLSTTKELDQEGQQHLRNVDNYHISTKCLNDLNSNSMNNKSKPFSLFTKKQEEYDISQNCDQSIIPQETSNSNGVSQTFQNNQKQKQSLPSTSSHQLIFNNENNYQTQFKDLLDWKIEGSKLELNTSHDQLIQNNSTDLSNKHTQNNLVSDKKLQKNCDCLKEITELKVMISEMQKNQIVQAQINQKLQQDNENIWKAFRQLKSQLSKNQDLGNSDCDQTKENAYADKENIKSTDKTKYKKIVKSLVSKNKELKKQNNEIEAVLKDILLQNEISRQRIGIRDKLSCKNSRANSRSGVSSNNETDFILDNHQNGNFDGNTSQNYHVYRPRSSSNASGINSTKRGNENKSLKSNPYHNILKRAKNLHENIEVLKQDSLILNQVGIHLNTYQSNDTKNISYTPQNENFGSINNYEQENSNDIKIRQILSKIQHHDTLQNS